MAELFRFQVPAFAIAMELATRVGRRLTMGEIDALCQLVARDDALVAEAQGRDVVLRPGPALVDFVARLLGGEGEAGAAAAKGPQVDGGGEGLVAWHPV